MEFKERRKHPRIQIDNLISYICIDDSGKKIKEGRGKALNINQGGILIETKDSFEFQDTLQLVIEIEAELVSSRARSFIAMHTISGSFELDFSSLRPMKKSYHL